jgi:hypothetical protein
LHELGRRVGLNANTVRWHLGVLADAGWVVSDPAPRQAPGRPRILYRLTEAAVPERQRNNEYRLLASILTGTVAEQEDAPASAERNGRAWGRYLVKRPLPLVKASEAEVVGQIVDLLDEQRLRAAVDGRRICMHRCQFHNLAETNPEIIYATPPRHGRRRARLGSDLRVATLDVFPEPDICRVELEDGAQAAWPCARRRMQSRRSSWWVSYSGRARVRKGRGIRARTGSPPSSATSTVRSS